MDGRALSCAARTQVHCQPDTLFERESCPGNLWRGEGGQGKGIRVHGTSKYIVYSLFQIYTVSVFRLLLLSCLLLLLLLLLHTALE